MMNETGTINLSIRRRRYLSNEYSLSVCPECGAELHEENCTILLYAKSDSDKAEFMTSLSGSHFCKKCPVVVFDINKIELAVKVGIRGDKNLRYNIGGIIDLEAIPHNKRHLEIGCNENPVPLVPFLPDINTQPKITDKTPGRNDPCICGSGKKYKKCCGN